MTSERVPLTVVVLAWNEARNLPACLDSVRDWAQDLVIVDSGSTDATPAIASDMGARVVTHPFETHARQWRWAIDSLPPTADWVLAIDADQRISANLRDAIIEALRSPASADVAGYFVNRRQVFRGRWIRHGGYYPKYLLKLFRRSRVRLDERDLVDHHFAVQGTTMKLAGDVVEDNQNEQAIADWIAKHNRYAVLQARQEVAADRRGDRVPFSALLGDSDARTRWRKQVWTRMPLFVRPCLYFGYRYVLRAGFLDGREGFVFHLLQGFWYRLLVDINISEQRAPGRSLEERGLHAHAQHDPRKS
jgi:glycosyltransferase involved in cell wall biosynthesis